MNPAACAQALLQAAAKAGLSPRIAVLDGAGLDAALTLGPLVHAFGWRWDQWDHLAAGIVAGHVLECGAQATGGNLTDWRGVEGLAEPGYPIAEVDADGKIVITKHPGTGGLVSLATVVEQLLYEIGDPGAYATPDVTADFTSIQLEEEAADRVRISGVRGAPPPRRLRPVSRGTPNGGAPGRISSGRRTPARRLRRWPGSYGSDVGRGSGRRSPRSSAKATPSSVSRSTTATGARSSAFPAASRHSRCRVRRGRRSRAADGRPCRKSSASGARLCPRGG